MDISGVFLIGAERDPSPILCELLTYLSKSHHTFQERHWQTLTEKGVGWGVRQDWGDGSRQEGGSQAPVRASWRRTEGRREEVFGVENPSCIISWR